MGRRLIFRASQPGGLPRESGPVLTFTRCPSNQLPEVSKQQGAGHQTQRGVIPRDLKGGSAEHTPSSWAQAVIITVVTALAGT